MQTAVIMTLPAKDGTAAYVAAIGALAGQLQPNVRDRVRQGRVNKGSNVRGNGRRHGGRRHDARRNGHRGRGRRNTQAQRQPKDQDSPQNDDHAESQDEPNGQASNAAVAPGRVPVSRMTRVRSWRKKEKKLGIWTYEQMHFLCCRFLCGRHSI